MACTLVIRADATPLVGAGHVMRCLTLADAWQQEGLGRVALVGSVTLPFVAARAAALAVEPMAPGSMPVGATLLVDDYNSDVRRQWAQARWARQRVLIDDAGDFVPAGYDWIWNPNPYGSLVPYPGFDGAILTGPDMVPVRCGIPEWRPPARERIGIALGGSRLAPHVREVFAILGARLQGTPMTAVGSGWPAHWSSVGTPQPWEDLVCCSRVVVSGGTTAWEAAYAGVPVVVVQIALNQSRSLAWARSTGAPVVDLSAGGHPVELAAQLLGALAGARPLPRLVGGARHVALRLAEATAVKTP